MELSFNSSSQDIVQQLRTSTKPSLINLRKRVKDAKNYLKWIDLFSAWRLVEIQNAMLSNPEFPSSDDNFDDFRTQLEGVLAALSKEADMSGGVNSSQY